jgi:hypothetical protein
VSGLVDANEELAGFFLPQLNQLLVLGALNPLLVWQPVMHAAEKLTTARNVMTCEILVRMADTSSRETVGEKAHAIAPRERMLVRLKE